MFHKRLLKEFGDNRKLIIGMVLTQWVMLIANVVLMYRTAGFISVLFQGKECGPLIFSLALVLLGVLIVRGVMSYINSRLSFETSEQLKQRLRTMIYGKLMRLGSSYREHAKTSEVVQISTEGVEQLEIYFGKYVPQFFYSMLAPITLFVMVGTMSMKVAIVLLLCVPLIPVSIVAVQKFAKKMLAKYWGTYTELGDSFLECLQGLTTLKIYDADERYAEKMDEESEKFRKVTMRVLIMQLNSISIMDLVAYGGAGIGIILAVLELRSGNISLAQCFFITMVSAEFFLPLRLLGSSFHIAMNGNAAADKIFRLLDEEEPVPAKVEALAADGESILELREVSFSYPALSDTSDKEKGNIGHKAVNVGGQGSEKHTQNENNKQLHDKQRNDMRAEEEQAHKEVIGEKQVLTDVAIQIRKGLTALVGESGCGKSTIISLLMKENTPEKGKVLIDGIDLRDISTEALYCKVTRVKHDDYLFAGTVEYNLRMGRKNATESEMYEALKQVQLYDFVMEKGGLSMELQEKAANLSGGQKQRLSLARALLHDTDIYIFDEAASNVDVESENAIMDVVKELAERKTVLLVSHRLANVVPADCIYVMQKGKIVDCGSHQALCEKEGYYYTLFTEQQKLEQYGREDRR